MNNENKQSEVFSPTIGGTTHCLLEIMDNIAEQKERLEDIQDSPNGLNNDCGKTFEEAYRLLLEAHSQISLIASHNIALNNWKRNDAL